MNRSFGQLPVLWTMQQPAWRLGDIPRNKAKSQNGMWKMTLGSLWPVPNVTCSLTPHILSPQNQLCWFLLLINPCSSTSLLLLMVGTLQTPCCFTGSPMVGDSSSPPTWSVPLRPGPRLLSSVQVTQNSKRWQNLKALALGPSTESTSRLTKTLLFDQ